MPFISYYMVHCGQPVYLCVIGILAAMMRVGVSPSVMLSLYMLFNGVMRVLTMAIIIRNEGIYLDT